MRIKCISLIAIIIILLLTGCTEKEINIFLDITIGTKTISVNSNNIYNNTEAESFPAVVRSSGEKPVETEYKGIELIKLFDSYNIDISNMEKVTFNAEDGYRVIMNTEEILDPKNVYLTYERDGKRLASKKNGGNGPFQLVIRRDPFSQRWIKHVNEIIIE
jgi:hypothetical protein